MSEEKVKVALSLADLQAKLSTKLVDIKDIGVFSELPAGVYLFAIDTCEVANLAAEGELEDYGIRTIVEVEACTALTEVPEPEDEAELDAHKVKLDEQIGQKLYKNYKGEKLLENFKKDFGFIGDHFGLDDAISVVEQAKGVKFIAEYVLKESKKFKRDDGTPVKFGNYASAAVV